MTLDKVRKEIEVIAERLLVLAGETRRRGLRPRGPRSSKPMTSGLKAKIKRLAAASPRPSQQQIALLVGVNPGRVSEVLNGKRK